MNSSVSREYLRHLIDSKGNVDIINDYIKSKNITLDIYENAIKEYILYLKEEASRGNIDKLYLEYTLKCNNLSLNKPTRRKFAEKIINIINNYIKEQKYNIKEYIELNGINYSEFKKFINSYKEYYLKDFELDILKAFLKRENDFNNDNIEKVKIIINKINNDLNNVRTYNIFDYFIDIGWSDTLLLYYLNNNKEMFNDCINNVRLYFDKNYVNDKYKLKYTDFINFIKRDYKDYNKKTIDNIITCMNKFNIPYNYKLFKNIIGNEKFKKLANIE